ncbi:hypothetical protein [Martelella radicis]|uniref:Lipoprotein n=1 Tax=Martelella radicis TaxID=1397476 RepID=A0A7W6KNG5_9HYPH|nr:hypothetical protein [Martelella radicis]MBB4123038.1 hypothetical protein [Martelella radicis]
MMRKQSFSKYLAMCGLALVSACSLNFLPGAKPTIPSPIAANPASLRIAVLAPEEFRLPKNEIVLTVYQKSGSGEISRDYTLMAADAAAEAAAVAEFRKPGQTLTVLRLSPAVALALRDQQQEMAAAREAGGAKPGFSVDLDATCWNGPMVAPAVPLDVLIEAGTEEGFHPLLQDIDIFALMNRPEESRLKPCP